ncbi:cytochrome C oxidase subunit IV family protein [Thioclava indica]|uniref:Nitric oxide reductase F protein n=1 Tax=Thioclava indica TaxID=1353528 RepID=A0A074KEW0_9RHOB|nr:cytochrome C oxidase subunit IV family protein [Thioclava indica]KEO60082.1 hypothetical protein DT23_14420 [Thioclava indica]
MTATQGWLVLVALSVGSTLLAWSGSTGAVAAVAILALAWVKAQIVLNVYLGLSQVPAWSRGFAFVLGLFMLGAMGLAVAAGAV